MSFCEYVLYFIENMKKQLDMNIPGAQCQCLHFALNEGHIMNSVSKQKLIRSKKEERTIFTRVLNVFYIGRYLHCV